MSRPHEKASLPAWQEFIAGHAAGGILQGQVTHVAPFGAFVAVAEGIVGLLPQSEWSSPPELGSSLAVKIRCVDLENRRMSFVPA